VKYKTTICFIILLSVICGCSKPEPSVVKTHPVPKKPASKKYILDVPAVTSETEYVEADSQTMAVVRVIDADTSLPITHATVCARWRFEDGPKMSFGKHTEDGVYLLPTNGGLMFLPVYGMM